MKIFSFHILNKKANQQLAQALLDLASQTHDEPDVIQRVKVALNLGADPNKPVNIPADGALVHQATYPLSAAMYAVNDQLVQMLLEHGANKTGVESPSRAWFRLALKTMGVSNHLATSGEQKNKDSIVKIGQLLVQHHFFKKSINDDTMFADPFYISPHLDLPQMDPVFQVLADGMDEKNIHQLRALANEWIGAAEWEPAIERCMQNKKSSVQHAAITQALADQNLPTAVEQQPTRKRKM